MRGGLVLPRVLPGVSMPPLIPVVAGGICCMHLRRLPGSYRAGGRRSHAVVLGPWYIVLARFLRSTANRGAARQSALRLSPCASAGAGVRVGGWSVPVVLAMRAAASMARKKR